MSQPRRRPLVLVPASIAALALLGLAGLAAVPSGPDPAGEPENYRKLQGMPRERRLALAENLERFDKLAPAERAAIRKLDAEIAAKDPVDQAKYRALLRRYHFWVSGLPEDQRRKIQDLESPEARFNAARAAHLKEKGSGPSSPRIAGVRVGEFGLVGPIEAAFLLKVWNKLTDAEKVDLEKHPDRGPLFQQIRALNQARTPHLVAATRGMSKEDEGALVARLEADEALRNLLGEPPRPAPSKKAEAKVDPAHQRFRHILAEFLYFDEHKPKPVNQRNLERFAESCPTWLRTMVDPLAPDDARAYLTILYRQVYTDTKEMPEPPPAAAKGAGPSAPAKAAPKATKGPI